MRQPQASGRALLRWTLVHSHIGAAAKDDGTIRLFSTLSMSMSIGDNAAVQLVLHFTRSAHEARGYPANELEPRIIGLPARHASRTSLV